MIATRLRRTNMSEGQPPTQWTHKQWQFIPNTEQQRNIITTKRENGAEKRAAMPNMTHTNTAQMRRVKIAETNCVEKGILIEQTENVRTYYKKLDHTVGVCSGEFTDYIYAEWHDGGPVHGRPISVKALEIMQVKL